jgi:hypothetical protein
MSRLFILAAISLLTTACAVRGQASEPPNPARLAQERHACADIMGYAPANADYAACVASLNDTLTDLDQAHAVQGDRSACLKQGLQPGTADFDVCVVKSEQSEAP